MYLENYKQGNFRGNHKTIAGIAFKGRMGRIGDGIANAQTLCKRPTTRKRN